MRRDELLLFFSFGFVFIVRRAIRCVVAPTDVSPGEYIISFFFSPWSIARGRLWFVFRGVGARAYFGACGPIWKCGCLMHGIWASR